MNPIQPTHRGAQGAAVATLHAGLLFLVRNEPGISDNDRRILERGLASELRDQVYKDWTTHLVSLFQEQLASRFQLVVNGDVDQATADALNKLLAELGAPGNGSPATPPQVPSHYTEKSLAAELVLRLGGRPADGSRPAASIAAGPPLQAVWVDAGDEVLVHLDSVAVRIVGRSVLVSVDLDSDQTGRTPLIVSFALGAGGDAAGLVAVTDELPRGNGLLAARWGAHLQAAVWAGILGIAQDFGAQQRSAPRALTITDGGLSLQAGPPLQAPPPLTPR